MNIPFYKYHALQNDFLIVEKNSLKTARMRIGEMTNRMCHRKSGIGADGLLLIGKSSRGDARIDVYNADGGWAEKSGNGLRIAGLHFYRKNAKNNLVFEMGNTLNRVRVNKGSRTAGLISTELGTPNFLAKEVPIKVKSKFMINRPLKAGGVSFPVTCLAIGNPHTVIFVDDLDFEWEQIGAEIENNRLYPNGTNVEFVKVLSRKKLKLAEWERGVGASGSSGTGAAAAVAAAVTLELADRRCRVDFESGSLAIDWRVNDNIIELTGPANFVCQGVYELP